MLDVEFQVLPSIKSGLNSKESYIVTRGKTSFLRILGALPSWELMTATASEDHGGINVCREQLRLVESALRLGAELKTSHSVENDWAGREYVKIGKFSWPESMSHEAFLSELYLIFSRFFEIYDSCTEIRSRGKNEMIDLYRELAVDDFGSDVYLSDGVWLSNDGSLHDRGR